MRAVFFGTPPHAVPSLAALCGIAEVDLVVTQPDRPRGRSRARVAPAVKQAASAWGLPLAQPQRAGDLIDEIGSRRPDVALVVAFGQLIPGDLLEIPATGFVNVHFSLLPRWRGASPVVRAILAGDERTGVTLMRMDQTLDTGPVYARTETPIRPGETAGALTARLAAMGAAMVSEHMEAIVAGRLEAAPQQAEGATAARTIRVEEAFVDPGRHGVVAVERAVRAFDPSPGAWTTVEGRRLKLWRVRPSDAPAPEPGTAVAVGERVVVGTPDGALELLEVQPEGRARMSGADWMRGRRGAPARLEPPGDGV
jgi:methionyl-tRNA formyltransferase